MPVSHLPMASTAVGELSGLPAAPARAGGGGPGGGAAGAVVWGVLTGPEAGGAPWSPRRPGSPPTSAPSIAVKGNPASAIPRNL